MHVPGFAVVVIVGAVVVLLRTLVIHLGEDRTPPPDDRFDRFGR